jgi:gliding motility-associated-like protein
MIVKKFKQTLLFLFVIINPCLIFSQKETNNWLFGYHAGLNFNSGLPSPINGGGVNTMECSASISDTNGNLLFYTDGDSVWDKNNIAMPNGFGLTGYPYQWSVTQGALIIQKPLSPNLYYIFNIGCYVNSFDYSIVDINANGGFGDVISKKNTIFSEENYYEKLTAIKHCNNRDVWIIIMGRDSTVLYSNVEQASQIPDEAKPVKLFCFLLTPYGISNYPVITNLGNLSTAICVGVLKGNPQGNKMAFGNYNGYSLLNFDKQIGIITNVKEHLLPIINGYGLEFSPNGKLLYFNKNQIDIATGTTIKLGYPTLSQFQLASDNKIYFANYDSSYTQPAPSLLITAIAKKLSVINNPNLSGVSCNVSYNSVSLGSDSTLIGLPNFPSYHFYNPLGEFTYQNDCAGNITNFTLVNNPPLLDSIKWVFMDDNSTSNALSPIHVYNIPGNHKVNVITYKNGVVDTVSQCVTITGSFSNFLGIDKQICTGENFMIGVTTPYIGEYLWSTGDTTAGITVNTPGDYTLQIKNNCATYSDVIHIEKGICDPVLFIPNVFTPNADNNNDVFTINTTNIKEFSYTIYNQWGIKMKEETVVNLSNAFQTIPLWDGRTTAGSNTTDGVYYFIIRYTSSLNKEYSDKGFITILR